MTTIVLTLLLTWSAPGPGAVIEIDIDSETIELADLLAMTDGDPRGQVSLGRAPAPGLARRLNDYEIESRLRSEGFSPDGLRLPSTFLVRRRSAVLDADQVAAVVLAAFEERFPGARIELIEVDLPPTDIATGPIDISATLPASFRPTDPVSVRVDAKSGTFSRSVFARTRISIETLQPVLARDIAAQSTVGPGDLRWSMTPLTSSATAEFSTDALEGFVAKHDLEAGDVLTDRMLYRPVLVRRGEAVTVEARVGNVRVSAVMQARDAGQYGETIIVEHLNGGGRTSARVTGPGTVEAVIARR